MTVQHKQLNSSIPISAAYHVLGISMLSKSPNGRYSDIGICKTGKKFPYPSRFLTISRFGYKVLFDWSISKSRGSHFFTSVARTMQSARKSTEDLEDVTHEIRSIFGVIIDYGNCVWRTRFHPLTRLYSLLLFTLQAKKSAKYIQRRGQKKGSGAEHAKPNLCEGLRAEKSLSLLPAMPLDVLFEVKTVLLVLPAHTHRWSTSWGFLASH